MPVIEISTYTQELASIVCRVENGCALAPDFCDRLTRSVAQLFAVVAAAASQDDLASFDRILVRIAPSASKDARLYLSDRLADVELPPRGTLLMLANDVIEVARPILVRSPALGEDDLVEIARCRGSGHMGVIAERVDLPVRVTDILVLRGDDEVRRIVAANPGAHFSDKGFSRLSLQARGDTVIEARLVRRGDLPDMVIRFLVENGSPTAREALAARAEPRPRDGLGCGTLPIRAAEDGWLEAYDFEAAATVVQRIPHGANLLDGFIRRLAQADHFPEVVHVLTESTGIRLDTMKHLMVSLDTEPFAVIARALALRLDTVLELLSTGPWLHRLDGRVRDAAVSTYRGLDAEEARGRLHRWAEQESRTDR